MAGASGRQVVAVGRPKYAPRRDAEAVAVAMDTGAALSAPAADSREGCGSCGVSCGEMFLETLRMRHAVISSQAKGMKASGQGRAVRRIVFVTPRA